MTALVHFHAFPCEYEISPFDDEVEARELPPSVSEWIMKCRKRETMVPRVVCQDRNSQPSDETLKSRVTSCLKNLLFDSSSFLFFPSVRFGVERPAIFGDRVKMLNAKGDVNGQRPAPLFDSDEGSCYL